MNPLIVAIYEQDRLAALSPVAKRAVMRQYINAAGAECRDRQISGPSFTAPADHSGMDIKIRHSMPPVVMRFKPMWRALAEIDLRALLAVLESDRRAG